jgi:hypothetical protein
MMPTIIAIRAPTANVKGPTSIVLALLYLGFDVAEQEHQSKLAYLLP